MKEVLMLLYTIDGTGYVDTITITRVNTQQECQYIIQSMKTTDNYHISGKCITVTKLRDTYETH